MASLRRAFFAPAFAETVGCDAARGPLKRWDFRFRGSVWLVSIPTVLGTTGMTGMTVSEFRRAPVDLRSCAVAAGAVACRVRCARLLAGAGGVLIWMDK